MKKIIFLVFLALLSFETFGQHRPVRTPKENGYSLVEFMEFTNGTSTTSLSFKNELFNTIMNPFLKETGITNDFQVKNLGNGSIRWVFEGCSVEYREYLNGYWNTRLDENGELKWFWDKEPFKGMVVVFHYKRENKLLDLVEEFSLDLAKSACSNLVNVPYTRNQEKMIYYSPEIVSESVEPDVCNPDTLYVYPKEDCQECEPQYEYSQGFCSENQEPMVVVFPPMSMGGGSYTMNFVEYNTYYYEENTYIDNGNPVDAPSDSNGNPVDAPSDSNGNPIDAPRNNTNGGPIDAPRRSAEQQKKYTPPVGFSTERGEYAKAKSVAGVADVAGEKRKYSKPETTESKSRTQTAEASTRSTAQASRSNPQSQNKPSSAQASSNQPSASNSSYSRPSASNSSYSRPTGGGSSSRSSGSGHSSPRGSSSHR